MNSESLEQESGDDDDVETKEKNASYDKIARAIGTIKDAGINVSCLNINESDYGFQPDVKNNRILYGLKALGGVNQDAIEKIVAGRPYAGIKDFMARTPLNKTAMLNLIKAGAFDEIDTNFGGDRRKIMVYYIMSISDPKKRITLQNFSKLIEYNLVPKELELSIRVFNFTKFLKKNCKNGDYYNLSNERLVNFITTYLPDVMDDTEYFDNRCYIRQSKWETWYKLSMEPVKEWMQNHQIEILEALNTTLFKETWKDYATGTLSAWEIQALCFYFHEHELANVDMNKYGIVEFNTLPTDPEVDYFFKHGGHQIPIYKVHRIIGTVLAKNDTRSTVTLLTPNSGVVDVKFTREYFALFKRQLAEVQPDGTKKIVEKSWFRRGIKLMVTGFRRDDMFVGKTYKNTNSHQLYKIVGVNGSELMLQHERKTTNATIEEDERDE